MRRMTGCRGLFPGNKMLVKDIMSTKVITVKKEDTLASAVKLMMDNDISGLPVVDRDNRLISMVTKSDIVQFSLPTALRHTGGDESYRAPDLEFFLGRMKDVAGKSVGCTMSRNNMVTASPEMNISEVAVKMYANGYRRLPVVDSRGSMVGIISYSDIARIIATE